MSFEKLALGCAAKLELVLNCKGARNVGKTSGNSIVVIEN
jgi:hypothetical protein